MLGSSSSAVGATALIAAPVASNQRATATLDAYVAWGEIAASPVPNIKAKELGITPRSQLAKETTAICRRVCYARTSAPNNTSSTNPTQPAGCSQIRSAARLGRVGPRRQDTSVPREALGDEPLLRSARTAWKASSPMAPPSSPEDRAHFMVSAHISAPSPRRFWPQSFNWPS